MITIDRVSDNLDYNISFMSSRFERDKTVIFRPLETGSGTKIALFFCDGMVSNERINLSIIKPLNLWENTNGVSVTLEHLQAHVIQINEVKQTSSFADIEHAMVYGDTILFCEGCSAALILNTKGFTMRSISEPEGETVIKGPREGFSEGILLNISMLRRKIRTSNLKLEYMTVGTDSKTVCCVCYIDNLVDKSVLKTVKSRISKVNIDGILGSNYIAEMIRDHKYSPFKTIGTTERPDVVCAKLLEGRVCVIVDGSPVALTVPYIFIEQFQAAEDYYVGSYFAFIGRMMRIIGFLLSISLAPIFVALVGHHPEMLPTDLLMAIAQARAGVPFPVIAECIGLLIVFDILREAASRTSSNVGQAISIVGGLVIGTAAVDANFVSVPVVIIVAFSGITGLIVPKLNAAVTALRYPFIILAAIGGIYAYTIGLFLLTLHICSLCSFGVASVSSSIFSGLGSHEDDVVRIPFNLMKKSGRFISRGDRL